MRDNLTLFLRGCEELGVKGSQLFDPGDLQDSSTRTNLKASSRTLPPRAAPERRLVAPGSVGPSSRLPCFWIHQVLITIYWLGKAANSCTSYSGPTLDLKEFEGLLSQMRKSPPGQPRGDDCEVNPLDVSSDPPSNEGNEVFIQDGSYPAQGCEFSTLLCFRGVESSALVLQRSRCRTGVAQEAEDPESPKRSVRDSGYVDSWDSERSDSLSSPRHGRDDSFDSLDSFGSRSLQTPSPDVVFRGSSDGRGSDSESDAPQRRLPDLRKDDMLARRTSCSELRVAVPFNQYLPNRSNQSSYVPGSQRRRRTEREEGRGSCGSAASPVGAERPFSRRDVFRAKG
ncbi:hypothetical protein Z043_121615 [Scleropages formosus]|uniref:DUF4757 domain-containing protein n=1 Tax=Scleropages formosus TaxID=113540 RepID=A0A0P7U187_SCLFO|nr:hypothetical protein Z043_121615 [Scleropages formosus]